MATLTGPKSVMRSRRLARLQKVTDVKVRAVRIEQELIEAVGAARESGASWSALGKALGVSESAAWQRFEKTIP